MANPSPSALKPGALRLHKGWLIALGVLTLFGGLAAIVWPVFASIAVTAVVGVAFLAQGVVQILDAWSAAGWRPRLWHVATGLIALVGGGLLLLNPLAGVLALTTVLIVVVLLSGATRVAMALQVRPQKGWGWLLTGGLISILCGGYLASLYVLSPEAGPEQIASSALGLLSVLGLMVGISMIFEGWAYILFALALPGAEEPVEPEFVPAPRPPAAPAPPGGLSAPAPAIPQQAPAPAAEPAAEAPQPPAAAPPRPAAPRRAAPPPPPPLDLEEEEPAAAQSAAGGQPSASPRPQAPESRPARPAAAVAPRPPQG